MDRSRLAGCARSHLRRAPGHPRESHDEPGSGDAGRQIHPSRPARPSLCRRKRLSTPAFAHSPVSVSCSAGQLWPGRSIGGPKPDIDPASLAKLTDKDQIVAALKASFDFVHKSIATLTTANAFESVRGPMTRASAAAFVAMDSYDEYGQMVETPHERNGALPPASGDEISRAAVNRICRCLPRLCTKENAHPGFPRVGLTAIHESPITVPLFPALSIVPSGEKPSWKVTVMLQPGSTGFF